jgi:hypothetical protein
MPSKNLKNFNANISGCRHWCGDTIKMDLTGGISEGMERIHA